MRILYCALKYDYGIPSQGFSYEHENFYSSLLRMPNTEVVYFPLDEVLRKVGRRALNLRFLENVEHVKPDLCFFALFTDEITPETIRKITKQGKTITYNWFSDDHWRFDPYSRYWAPLFHWVSTTDNGAVEKYRSIGYHTVIKTQWACNSEMLRQPTGDELKHDATFVGQPHSDRRKMIAELKRSGVSIECWGKGWPNGRVSQQQMMKIYRESKISLNFAGSSPSFGWEPIAKIFLTRRSNNQLRLNRLREMTGQLRALSGPRHLQIKARVFEIPGAGGVLLTSQADGLTDYYLPGKEIAVFDRPDDLVEKVQYYLSHDQEREEMRRAGYLRTQREHTYEKRFQEIFRTMGLHT
jgi:spore maturation protein CgeB